MNMAIAPTNGQILKAFGNIRIKHRSSETCVVDEVMARALPPADICRAEIAWPQKLVLHITLDEKPTMKGLAADILAALGADRD
jgi:hypothetical protein